MATFSFYLICVYGEMLMNIILLILQYVKVLSDGWMNRQMDGRTN